MRMESKAENENLKAEMFCVALWDGYGKKRRSFLGEFYLE
jgi:hypothetical protein